MNGLNLIPESIMLRRHRGRLIRRWKLGGAAYAALLFLGASLVALMIEEETPKAYSADNHLAEWEQRMGDARQTVNELRSRRDELAVLEHRPDWAGLLSEISSAGGEDVVLRELILTQVSGQAMNEPPGMLELAGVGRSQGVVSSLALSLESMPVFETVVITETRLEPFLQGQAVGFRFRCTLAIGEDE